MNNDEHDKPENETPLDRDAIHEQNKKEEHEARQRANANPSLGKGVNPTHHDIGNK